jgi:galactokinase/mevalonate kinase-like predicted kinase
MESSIRNNDFDGFFSIINEGWAKKKETSSEIMSNPTIQELDGKLSNDPSVLAHKLCGAGGGGYFLVFKKKYSILNLDSLIKINLSDRAITCKTI